jgi:hypothetical protein
MQSENKIHLVPRTETQFLRPQLRVVPRAKTRKRKVTVLTPQDIVRETLVIAREHQEVLAGGHISKDQLLIDLVASLAWRGFGKWVRGDTSDSTDSPIPDDARPDRGARTPSRQGHQSRIPSLSR